MVYLNLLVINCPYLFSMPISSMLKLRFKSLLLLNIQYHSKQLRALQATARSIKLKEQKKQQQQQQRQNDENEEKRMKERNRTHVLVILRRELCIVRAACSWEFAVPPIQQHFIHLWWCHFQPIAMRQCDAIEYF